MPNMYARGIVFGKMILELGDTCIAQNLNTRMTAELDFKTKVLASEFPQIFCWWQKQGFFTGTYNAINGKLKKNGSDCGEISGRWSHVMELKTVSVLLIMTTIELWPIIQANEKRILFDAHGKDAKIAAKDVAALDDQEPNESRLSVVLQVIESFWQYSSQSDYGGI